MKLLIHKLKMSGIGIDLAGEKIKLDIPEGTDATGIINEVKRHRHALVAYIKKIREAGGLTMRRPRPMEKREVYDIFYQQAKEYYRFLILGDHAFNSNFILSCENLDRPALEKVLQTIFLRHESLRTTFLQKDNTVQQKIHDAGSLDLKITYLDMVNDPDKEEMAARLLKQAKDRRFNFEKELLVDVTVVRYSVKTWALLFTTHHAICDASSSVLLKKEIELLYNAYKEGRPDPLPPLQLQYRDYAHWVNSYVRGPAGRQAGEFYKRTIMESLAGEYRIDPAAPAGHFLRRLPSYRLHLHRELVRAVGTANEKKYRAAYGVIVNLYPERGAFYKTSLDASITEKLKKMAEEHRSTLFNVLIAAFSILLYKEGRNRYVRMSIPYSSRVLEEFEAIVGWLTSEIIVSIRVDPGLHFKKFLGEVTDIILETATHQFYPPEKIMHELDIDLEILAPVLINFIELTDTAMKDFKPFHDEKGSGHFNMHCKITEYRQGMTLEVNYKRSAYSDRAIGKMMEAYKELLEEISTHPDYVLTNCLPCD